MAVDTGRLDAVRARLDREAQRAEEPPDDGPSLAELLDSYEDEPRANGHTHEPAAGQTGTKAIQPQFGFDPDRARSRLALLDESPEPVEVIVDEIQRRTAGTRNASGGTGKSNDGAV
jgi:hypothetical protein